MRKQQGQALVEFALVLMLIILPVTFVFIETAVLLFALSNVTNAAREGAREGSVYSYNPDGANLYGCLPIDYTGNADNQVTELDCWRRSEIVRYLNEDQLGRLRNFVDASSCLIEVSYLQPYYHSVDDTTVYNIYRSQQPIKVDLACPHRLLFGLVPDSVITLSATSTMNIEPGSGIVPTPTP